jgi:hypothetical protein
MIITEYLMNLPNELQWCFWGFVTLCIVGSLVKIISRLLWIHDP